MELLKIIDRVDGVTRLDIDEKICAKSLLKKVGVNKEPICSFDRMEVGGIWRNVYGVVLHSGTYIFKDLPDIDGWILLGMYYGYPKCCIKHFYLDKSGGVPMEDTGYVMCPKCAKMNRERLVTEINKRRISKYPFPDNVYSSELMSICHFLATTDFTDIVEYCKES